MKNAKVALGLICIVAIIFCLGGCTARSQNAQLSSSETISSSSSSSSSSATESQNKSSSALVSSIADNQAKSSSAPVSSSAESQKKPSGAPTEAEDEIIYIEPNRDLPNTPPETDNQKPSIIAKEPRSQQYESGKVLLTCIKIDGTTYEVEVTNAETKNRL